MRATHLPFGILTRKHICISCTLFLGCILGGNQFVITLLSGQGTLQYKDEKPSPVQFTCLLENNQKAVFSIPRTTQHPTLLRLAGIIFIPETGVACKPA